MGLLRPSAGVLEIDKQVITEANHRAWQMHIAHVPQTIFLADSTIEENIAFGIANNFNEVDVLQAAKDAVVYDNIMEFPQKFDTLIGERGVTLSGGQKQRISIARAIIKNPDLLIFDDCLSAVDTITEEKILNNLNSIMAERTSILISHRVATVKSADKIIVLDDGKIIESGTHEELLKKGELYASFYELQKMEEEVS
jgi:ATP-binding cassette subfamily B protein